MKNNYIIFSDLRFAQKSLKTIGILSIFFSSIDFFRVSKLWTWLNQNKAIIY